MASYQAWRDDFVARLARLGATSRDARYLLRQASTLQRLAEAQCNGDWPADNGERRVDPCDVCGGCWVPSTLTRARQPGASTTADTHRAVCPDCRAGWRVQGYLLDALPGWGCELHGDPRGCVLRVYPPAGADCAHTEADRQSGRCGHVIGVPTR